MYQEIIFLGTGIGISGLSLSQVSNLLLRIHNSLLNMILYGITINIERQIHEQWIEWMKTQHVPAVLGCGLIQDSKILKLLNEEDGNPGVTYSFQYFFKDLNALQKFQEEFEPGLDTILYSKYRNSLVDFRTILEVIT